MISNDDNTATIRDSFNSPSTGRISGTSLSRVVITVGGDFCSGENMMTTCGHCGKEIQRARWQIKRSVRVFCSTNCRLSHSRTLVGSLNCKWIGGISVKSGRAKIYNPGHPHCVSANYVHRYRLVIEKHIGRYLLPSEVVHHINGNKLDDRIENLALMSKE